MIQKTQRYIVIELVILFVILPVLYIADLIPFHKIIPLVFLVIYCTVILVNHKQVSANRFYRKANWKMILLRFLGIAILIMLLVELLFHYPLMANFRENKNLLLIVLIYPVISAFPQELIFRKFFFYRYGILFRRKELLVGVNTALFSFAHIYYANWTVLIFTLVGGLIFSVTYLRTRSLLVVTIEHSLYGMLILSSGLSPYFYKAF